MFDFFWKKEIKDKNVKRYKGAVKAIKIYTSLKMYKKAIAGCNEVILKEKDSLANLIRNIQNKIGTEKIVKKETKVFKNRKNELEKLKQKAELLYTEQKNELEKIRFEKKFKEIKNIIQNKIKLGKSLEAMGELKFFLKENKNRVEVVDFYNKEKRIIQNSIDKEKRKLKEKLENDVEAEAMTLIGKEIELNKKETNKNIEKKSIFKKIFEWMFNIDKIRKKIEEERVIEEINNLIELNNKEKENLAKAKLENMHKGLIKEIRYNKLIGYDIYGKILGADKISGDSFGINERKNNYTFFLGDATGHGIKAGFIITLLNRAFRKFAKKPLNKMVFEINNSLKQNLESKNFVTGAFFEVEKENHKLSYIGMGHEPIILYKNKEKKAEKKVLGGLAAGIRIIKNLDDVKVKELEMEDSDIFMIFSDGIVETKNEAGEYYGIERLRKTFELIVKNKVSLQEIYEYIMSDVKLFRGGSRFDDDASILIVKRDKTKDLVNKKDNFISEIRKKENLNRSEAKMLEGKTKEEIKKEILKIKKKRETERIVRLLKNIYYNGEILKLKQEAIRYVKEGYIDKRINNYLKKAIANEKTYKIEIKNQKMQNKYKVLEELLKKGDYETVIRESGNIIAKDGTL